MLPAYSSDLKKWNAPFIMAASNTRVVRRSASLAVGTRSDVYGDDFTYNETICAPNVFMALLMTIGFFIFAILIAFRPTRWLVSKVDLHSLDSGVCACACV